MLLNWDDTWELDKGKCPCDFYFLEWIEQQEIKNKTLFHMGTGTHHLVGNTLSTNDSNNLVIGLTACPEEYDCYMRMAIDDPRIGGLYKPVFTDIYQLDPRQLPIIDVATLFHLCEFPNEIRTVGPGIGDRAVIEIMIDKLSTGGHLLFYSRSFGFRQLEPIINDIESQGLIVKKEDYKSLRIYARSPDVKPL